MGLDDRTCYWTNAVRGPHQISLRCSQHVQYDVAAKSVLSMSVLGPCSIPNELCSIWYVLYVFSGRPQLRPIPSLGAACLTSSNFGVFVIIAKLHKMCFLETFADQSYELTDALVLALLLLYVLMTKRNPSRKQ